MRRVLNRKFMDNDFLNYYIFPLSSDGYHYIWAADDLMAFEFSGTDDPENMQKIVDILNGISNKVLPDITVDYPFIKCCGQNLLEIRGKGMLNARYNISETVIVDMQKSFLGFCAGKLSGRKIY